MLDKDVGSSSAKRIIASSDGVALVALKANSLAGKRMLSGLF